MTTASEPIVAIVGPTASGKTALALELAEAFGAEIVNADSRQVYRGLDIGSAKPTVAERQRVPHHVVDVAAPDEPFHCARFLELAEAAIADIRGRGLRVLVVGGTGLYVRVLRGGLFPGPARDPELRAAWMAREVESPGFLHRCLAAVDPVSAARLHPRDHVRLIRALEVYEKTGRPMSWWQAQHRFGTGRYPLVLLGVSVPRAELYRRIDARCRAMVASGLVEEVRRLYAQGYGPELPALQSLGYREIGAYVRAEMGLEEAIAAMARETRRFAKRQLTWFRREPVVEWLPPEAEIWEGRLRTWWP
ncbi:MAG: tRNA (adenosine(37)-N6)-dimethylallyltransferase MiaA [Candidatus Binatia bacterium]|nr:tRNA (adenosine(37)-N6)-dimethylallyltransferase MiaA [Candidatus Binatia bacterium]